MTAGAAPIGVYIHVPFCRAKCPYCDFYSLRATDPLLDRYTEALLRAIETQPFGPITADSLYFGGGTPALLGPDRLRRVLCAAREAFGLDPAAEITLEANPASAMGPALAALRATGVNRISFGVQSLVDRELEALGRAHSAAQAEQAIRDAVAAGFENISADLMLAVPGQSRESLAASIDRLCALPVEHLSAYLLKIEEDTPFGRQESTLTLPGEDETAQLYLDCVERLEAHGFLQYEISNFARNGKVSRHNLKYWRCEEYLGIGPAAHGFLHGQRFFFPRDLEGFLAAERPFDCIRQDGAGGAAEEQAMLRLRLVEGFSPGDAFNPEQAARMQKKARTLEARGLVKIRNGRIALTPEGFLLESAVIFALIDSAGV